MKHNLIGTTEYVYLLDVMDTPLPAKVDTGADGSAIWATSIEEKDGTLSFALFAPQSAFYTGDVITTEEYRIVSVKNSFGEQEYRYRVKLRMKIARRTYVASFTLADRSRSRFPILIGKRFLKGRFLVDVSRHNLTYGLDGEEVAGRVVILASEITKKLNSFYDTVSELSAINVKLSSYSQLDYRINDSGEPRILLDDGTDIASAQSVYIKDHAEHPEHAGAVARYLQYRHVNFLDREMGSFVSRSRLSELFILASSGVSVPATIVYSDGLRDVTYADIIEHLEAKSFVLSSPFAGPQEGSYLVSDESSFAEAANILKDATTLIAQVYIQDDHYVRVLMMGNDAVRVVRRPVSGLGGPLRLKTSAVDDIEMKRADYPADAIALAVRAANIMGRTVADVELVQDKTSGKWYVLKVRYNPNLTDGKGTTKKAKAIAELLIKEGHNR